MYPPLGILIMSALLKKEGHDVSFIDGIIENLDGPAVAKTVKDIHPDLVGITINVMQVTYSKEYIKEIKKLCGEIPIVIGGPFVSALPHQIYECMGEIDFAITGEGEYAILDLVRYLQGKASLDQVRNLVYKEGNKLKWGKRERIVDLDQLPLPDYSLVDSYIPEYSGAHPCEDYPSLHIMCTRGCPFKCKFCSSPVTWKSQVTYRKISSILGEAETLVSRYGAKEIFLQDDTLNLNRKWFTSLCDEVIKSGLNKKVFFRAPFRVNKELIDEDLLQKAKLANFWMIFYGVESGSQKMLDSMDKNVKVDEIIRAFKLTHEAGIKSFASFIIGCPGETHRTVNESFGLVEKIRPDFGGFAIATPFPGTELYNEVCKYGLADNLNLLEYDPFNTNIRTRELSHHDILTYTLKGNELIYDISLPKNNRTRTVIDRDLPDSAFKVEISLERSPLFLTINVYTEMILKIKNISNSIWPAKGLSDGRFQINLGYHWFSEKGETIVYDGLRTPLTHDLYPNEEVNLKVTVLTPDTPGNYILEFDLVQEMVAWFQQKGSKTCRVNITVYHEWRH